MKSENVHQKRNVTLTGLTATVRMFFSPVSTLSPFYKQQRRLLSFIYARSFVSDVQMGVNKGRWEGGRYRARQIYLSSIRFCQTNDDP